MTEKEAHKLTIDLWSFLAEDETRDKHNHPMYLKVYSNFRACCPLCEYYFDDYYEPDGDDEEGYCHNCPLNTKETQCDVIGSPFNIWGTPTSAEGLVAKAAQDIVDITKTSLESLT